MLISFVEARNRLQPVAAPPRPAIAQLIDRFDASRAAAGYRERGRARYCELLAQAATTVGATPAADIATQQLRRHQESIAAAGGSPSTIQVSRSALVAFFAWCVAEGIRADNPAAGLDWPRRIDAQIRALPAGKLAAIRQAMRTPANLREEAAWIWERNRRTILLALHAGLRISEIWDLRASNIHWDRRMLSVVGKRGKRREVALNATLGRTLASYRDVDPETVIVSEGAHGRRFSRPDALSRAVWTLWLGRDLGVPGVTPHMLRHSFATQMLVAGADVRKIQIALGHADLNTTMRYLGVDAEGTRSAVELLDAEWADES
jgi:integrase/recombinase XerD